MIDRQRHIEYYILLIAQKTSHRHHPIVVDFEPRRAHTRKHDDDDDDDDDENDSTTTRVQRERERRKKYVARGVGVVVP